MAGIYIHIPFCKKICYYCDFYRTRNLSLKEPFIAALREEMIRREGEGQGERVETIYFGGGTPSVLTVNEIGEILEVLYDHYRVDDDAEVTFEANPEDLSASFAGELQETGVNRLSIGCQSFRDKDLRLMNRRHDAAAAQQAVRTAAAAGFKNISADLIYGIPGLPAKEWKKNLETAFSLPIQHLSAYLLTFEAGTVFGKRKETGKMIPPGENEIIEQYELLTVMARKRGFIHYEISNFGKPGFFSRHNILYWKQKKYLGFGPSAHSYDLRERKWNVADVKKYIEGMKQGKPVSGKEVLTDKERFNDYVMTSLRTMWGVDTEMMEKNFSRRRKEAFLKAINKWIITGHVEQQGSTCRLTDAGILLSDTILSDCMAV